MLQIGPHERRVGQMAAELPGLDHCRAVVGSDHRGPRLAADLAGATTPTTGIENSQSAQIGQGDSCFGLKCGAILVVVGHFVFLPIPTETRQMPILGSQGRSAGGQSQFKKLVELRPKRKPVASSLAVGRVGVPDRRAESREWSI